MPLDEKRLITHDGFLDLDELQGLAEQAAIGLSNIQGSGQAYTFGSPSGVIQIPADQSADYSGASLTYATGTPAIATGGATLASWSLIADAAANGYFDATKPSRLTAPAAGVYRVHASVFLGFSGGGGEFAVVGRLVRNGDLVHGVVAQAGGSWAVTAENEQTLILDRTIRLAASDYLEVNLLTGYAGVLVIGGSPAPASLFELSYLGA